ncbi:PAS domain S-box protein [Myxococcota bacterium]|nr:PAS domain S-box protein [Myxococcota bacterium]MBU1536876.1 PAS domain S-box protein [Myxococcota bacterium]
MFNIVGHFLKIVSFYLIYAAIIHMGLQKPYSSLFSDLAHSEKKYRSLFEAMLSGFAHHKIICDKEGNPVDYRFLSVNPAFESLTGLRAEKLIGKTVLEVMPETEPHWIQRYGSVALSGKPAHFEEFSGALDKHYRISAFSPAKGEFACIFQDVTEQTKSAEEREELIEQLKEALERVKTLQDIIPICSYCKQIRDDEGAWTRLEEYFLKYSDARFSHGICPDCYEKQVQQMDKDEKPS